MGLIFVIIVAVFAAGSKDPRELKTKNENGVEWMYVDPVFTRECFVE